MSTSIERMEKRAESEMVPRPVEERPGMVRVDATWGHIQPMQITEGVRTIGELELIAHIERGLPVVDSRTRRFHEESTIPSARNIPHADAAARMDELNRTRSTVFFCNGPQCAQSPWAIRALLEASYPPKNILYYRGGMHDWVTLGLPVTPGK